MSKNVKAIHKVADFSRAQRFNALNYFNSYWFSPARTLNSKEKEEASMMMRGPDFLDALVEHFKNGQFAYMEDGEVTGLLFSLKAHPSTVSSFPSAEEIRGVAPEPTTTIICLAAASEIARLLVSALHGYVEGTVYAFAYARDMRAVFDEKPMLEDARVYLSNALTNKSDRWLNIFQDVGFRPSFKDGAVDVVGEFTHDPLSWGFAVVMEKHLS